MRWCFRFDRFARSVSHLARALDKFRALGIEFVSLHEAIDTSTPTVESLDEMASRGLSGRAIAKATGVSEATVRRILLSRREGRWTTIADAGGAPLP